MGVAMKKKSAAEVDSSGRWSGEAFLQSHTEWARAVEIWRGGPQAEGPAGAKVLR